MTTPQPTQLLDYREKIIKTQIRMVIPSCLNILTTRRCNAECVFCEFSCVKEGAFIPVKIFNKIINEAQELGIGEIALDGGEFLCHPEAEQIILLLGKANVSAALLTNGFLFSRYASLLRKNNVNRVVFGIDSFNPVLNDQIKKVPGLTEVTIKGIEQALDLGFEVGLHSVLSALNVWDLPNYLKIAASISAKPLMVSSVNLTGRALQNKAQFDLTSLQKRFIRGAYNRYSQYVDNNNGFFAYRGRVSDLQTMTQYQEAVGGCKYFSGHVLAINWNGEVPFCALEPSLNRSKFPKFSLASNSLKKAIQERERVKKRMEQLIKKRSNEVILGTEHSCDICYQYFKRGI